jgi:hypothetical protein
MTETTRDIEIISQRDELISKKNELLFKYKALAEPLEFAQNDFEKGLIEEKRAALAKEIKSLAAQIERIKEV